MIPTQLRSKTLRVLRDLAGDLGVRLARGMRKEDLVRKLAALERRGNRKKAAPKAAPGAPARRRGVKTPNLGRLAPSARRGRKSVAKTVGTAKTLRLAREEKVADEAAHKFDLPRHPVPPSPHSPHDDLGELPEAYGTGLLFLVARDPYWLYAAWDYTSVQLREMARAARHGELKLRIFAGDVVCRETTLNPGAREGYVKVDHASTEYRAEFGWFDVGGGFVVASRSASTRTPPDAPSPRTEARFATIPFGLRFHDLLKLVEAHRREGEELMDALQRLQAEGFEFPFCVGAERPWTAEQARHFASLLSATAAARAPAGSQEAAEAAARRSGAPWKRPTASGEGSVRSD